MIKEVEVWKTIKGYPDYMVSNTGKVKSTDRYIKHWRGGLTKKEGKMLTPLINKKGYLFVHLCKNGKSISKRIHRLVAEAFIPNPDNLPIVNHKDENKQNNHISNLEWCTNEYNCNYGTAIERMRKTKIDNGQFKYPELWNGLCKDKSEYMKKYKQLIKNIQSA